MPAVLIYKAWNDLKKTAEFLEHSVEKYKPIDPEKDPDSDSLVYYDALAFRFEKCVEISLSFYKTLELHLYGKPSDTLRDRLLIMQKLNLVNDPEFWIEARLLRNRIAHTYETDELSEMYNEIKEKSGIIIETINRIEEFLRTNNLLSAHNI